MPNFALLHLAFSPSIQRDLLERISDTTPLICLGQSGSAALGLAQTSDSRTDGYFEHHLNSWDVLAAALLVREAGGKANKFLTGNSLIEGN